MKKIDLRTKAGRALKARQERRNYEAQSNELVNPTPVIGGTGVRGTYVPLALDAGDAVNAPAHYTEGGIETIDFIRAKLSHEQFKGYCRGNALKYLSRAELKGGVEDYRKAAVYLGWLNDADQT